MSASQTVGAVLATVAGLAAIVIDQVSADAGTGEGPLVVGLAGAVTVGAAVLLFAGAMPRATRGAGGTSRTAETALLTSAFACLSVASAWTGLPFVLGAGGAMLGTTARRGATQPRQRRAAACAIALGISAIALGCAAIALV